MVITLLQTCGHYFDRGSSKRKLDQFLIHFQRYILSKGALPLDIEFDLQVTKNALFIIRLRICHLELIMAKRMLTLFMVQSIPVETIWHSSIDTMFNGALYRC